MRFLPALAMGLALCGQAHAAGMAYTPDQTAVIRAISDPEIGTQARVEIGERVLSAETGTEVPAIELRQAVTAETEATRITIPPGRLYKRGRGDGGIFYQTGALATVVFQGAEQQFPKAGLFVPTDKTRPVLAYWYLAGQPNAVTIPTSGAMIAPTDNTESDGFRMELVYSGATKGVVSLSYREFKDGYARPAFNQQLTYDLADGAEIGFRGARIRIIKATNTSLQYVVLRSFAPQ